MPEEFKQDCRLDSIKVSCTSKGAFSFEVKRYYDHNEDEPALVIQSIEKIYRVLKGKFNRYLINIASPAIMEITISPICDRNVLLRTIAVESLQGWVQIDCIRLYDRHSEERRFATHQPTKH